MMWSVQNSLNLMQPFLDLLFEVCHIVLGLRPQCRHLEYDIGRIAFNLYIASICLFIINSAQLRDGYRVKQAVAIVSVSSGISYHRNGIKIGYNILRVLRRRHAHRVRPPRTTTITTGR